MLVVVVVMATATFTRFYFVSWIGERVTADLRRAVFDHLLTLPPAFFEVTRTGEVISRLTNDTTMLETVIGSSASMAIRNLLLLVGGLVMLALTSAKLTLLVLAGVPLVVVPIVLFGRRVRKLARASQDRVGDVGAYVDEALHEIRTVQAYGHEARTGGASASASRRRSRPRVARIRQRALLVASVILLVFGAVGVILWIGGHDVVAGRHQRRRSSRRSCSTRSSSPARSARSARSSATCSARPARPSACSSCWPSSPRSARRRTRSRCPRPRAARSRSTTWRFHYPSRPRHAGARRLLARRARRARTSRWSGPSGAGKTTVFQLLLRFYDPQAGRVRIDGVDVRAADPRDVRARLAVVPQDPVIFAATRARERPLRPARRDRRRGARRCEAAYATEFIERLPKAIDSDLGERGVRLSGGQRQRLAIARAILADRPILLLDEATSALDAESERMVQLALERLMAGRTVLIIAHRLATVRHADRIAVMEHGPHRRRRHARRAARDQPALRAPRGAAVRGGSGGASGLAEPAVATSDRSAVRMTGSPRLRCDSPDQLRPCSSPFPNSPYELHQPFQPAGDQPEAIAKLVEGLERRPRVPDAARRHGLGQDVHDGQRDRADRPAGARARAQQDARRAALLRVPRFFPNNAVEYFVSYYDYYQPEAYVPSRDLYIEKDSSINEHIEQMRLSATKAILERPDCVIVATVSAIYGIGDPSEYHSMILHLKEGDTLTQRDAIKRLTEMQYTRNEADFQRGTFRVRGDVLDIFPAEHAENAVRISLFDDEVESLQLFDPLTGHIKQRIGRFTVFPSSHYVTGPAEGARRHRGDQGRARAAEGVLRRADEADRGAADRAAHALRPRDDDRDRLLQGHRELLAPPVRPQGRRAAADADRLPAAALARCSSTRAT